MKQVLPFLFLGFFSHGQITLTSQNFCDPSESYVFSSVLDLNIDYTSTGANYVWDYSYLSGMNQRTLEIRPMSQVNGLSSIMFGSFAPTAYKATYFSSTTDLPLAQISSFLPVEITEMNLFTKKESSKITSVGYEFKVSGQGVGFRSDTIETRYVFPLNFGDSYESRGFTKVDLNPIYDAQWKQYRQRQSTVDGWGTVQTPFGSFPALRIHHIIEELDSIYLSTNGTGFWIPIPVPTTHEYEWRSTEDKEAVMRIRTNVVLGNEVVSSVEYRDNLAGLTDLTPDFQLEIYPNPAKDYLHITSSISVTQVILVDASGRIWHNGLVEGTEQVLNVSELPSGSYFVVVFSDSSVSTKELIK